MDLDQHRLKIVEGLRKGFEKCKHYTSFTKRNQKILQAELPEYYVNFHPTNFFNKLDIYNHDMGYSNSVVLYLKLSKPWTETFIEEVNRADPSDFIERLEQEEGLKCELAFIESRISTLKERILEAQEQALNLVKALPIPKSATTRNDPVHWNGPSGQLKELFPLCFDLEV